MQHWSITPLWIKLIFNLAIHTSSNYVNQNRSASCSSTLVSNLGYKKGVSLSLSLPPPLHPLPPASPSRTLAVRSVVLERRKRASERSSMSQVHTQLGPCSSVLELPDLEANPKSLHGLHSLPSRSPAPWPPRKHGVFTGLARPRLLNSNLLSAYHVPVENTSKWTVFKHKGSFTFYHCLVLGMVSSLHI